jgi:hypothetical protein
MIVQRMRVAVKKLAVRYPVLPQKTCTTTVYLEQTSAFLP